MRAFLWTCRKLIAGIRSRSTKSHEWWYPREPTVSRNCRSGSSIESKDYTAWLHWLQRIYLFSESSDGILAQCSHAWIHYLPNPRAAYWYDMHPRAAVYLASRDRDDKFQSGVPLWVFVATSWSLADTRVPMYLTCIPTHGMPYPSLGYGIPFF